MHSTNSAGDDNGSLTHLDLGAVWEERDSEFLVYHQSKDAHLSGTSLVELDCTLGKLGFRIEIIPTKVNESISEVTNEFVLTSYILHHCKLQEANEGNDLGKSSGRHCRKGRESSRDGCESVTGKVNVSRKPNSSSRNKITDNS